MGRWRFPRVCFCPWFLNTSQEEASLRTGAEGKELIEVDFCHSGSEYVIIYEPNEIVSGLGTKGG